MNLYIIGSVPPDILKNLRRKYSFIGLFYEQDREIQYAGYYDLSIGLNFASESALLKSLEGHDIPKPEAIITRYENYILVKSWMARHFGLPGPDEQSSKIITDKFLMREKFQQYDPSITPNFSIVKSWEDILKFTEKQQFPVMLKPTNLVKSLLITKNDSLEELKANYEHMLKHIDALYEKYGSKYREANIIIEEYVEGTLHSTTAFIDNNSQIYMVDVIADLTRASEVGIADNHLFARTVPSSLPKSVQDKILEVSEKGIRAIGIKNSAFHIEIMNTEAGPKIIEIGGRVGGYRSRFYELGFGIAIDEAEVAISAGRKPDLSKSKNSFCSVIELFPENEGTFVAVTNEDQIKNLPSLNYFRYYRKLGERVGHAANGYKAAVIIIIQNDNESEFNHDFEFIKNQAKIVTKN